TERLPGGADLFDHVEVSPGDWLYVAQWIDDPLGFNVDALLARAAAAADLYTSDSLDCLTE
ncbi:MAG: hypothetical protein ACTSXZ_10210, partial [Alphaproteobacteria bacterium]